MSFWDNFDDRPVDVHPGYEAMRPQTPLTGNVTAAPPVVEQCSHVPCSQNDTAGVCDWCGIASDDVLLGVCSDCV